MNVDFKAVASECRLPTLIANNHCILKTIGRKDPELCFQVLQLSLPWLPGKLKVPMVANGTLPPIKRFNDVDLSALLHEAENENVISAVVKDEQVAKDKFNKKEQARAKTPSKSSALKRGKSSLALIESSSEVKGSGSFIDQLRQFAGFCTVNLRIPTEVSDCFVLLGVHAALASKVCLTLDGQAKVVKSWSALRRQLKKYAYKLANTLPSADDIDMQGASDDDPATTSAEGDHGDVAKYNQAQAWTFLCDEDNVQAPFNLQDDLVCPPTESKIATHF